MPAGALAFSSSATKPRLIPLLAFMTLFLLPAATTVADSKSLELGRSDSRRQLLVRPRHREGRRTHLASRDPEQKKVYSDWDGQPSWEWDNPRTMYFEPVAGLGNRLRALASAVVVAREAGVGLKVIWREEVECGPMCGSMPPFNSTWGDLFSYPKLRLASNFPGSNYSVHEENVWLRPNMSVINPDMPPVVAGFNCNVHNAQSYGHLKELLANSWTHVNGEEVLCIKSELWLTKNGERDGKFFYRLLQPSPLVKKMMDDFKLSIGWDERHFIGVHIRRTDLAITQPDGTKKKMENLLSLSKYIDVMRKLTALATGVKGISYFIATDDIEAEKMMRSSFEDGLVFNFPKTAWSRSTVAGIQQALVDVLLLSECPILIGTYYSSYSETAKLIGWPYYIQIGSDLSLISLETHFDANTSS